MKTLAVLSFVVGACLAQQLAQERRPPVPIISQVGAQGIDGTFNYGFEAGNGIQSSATGSIRSLGPKGEQAQVVQGSYSYIAPDGTPINTQYTADETGFHVSGPHIPTPPPVPAAIARSLEYIASQPAQPQYQQPQYQQQYQQQQYQQQQYKQQQYQQQQA